MDAAALGALGRLIAGPIKGWSDLEAAEMAIRAFVFHDFVHRYAPAYKGHYVFDKKLDLSGLATGAGMANIEPAPGKASDFVSEEPVFGLDAIEHLSKAAGYQVYASNVDYQIVAFKTPEIEKEFRRRNEKDAEKPHQEQPQSTGGTPPTVNANFTSGPLEDVCANHEKYWLKVFHQTEGLMRRYLREIGPSGSPAYIGLPRLRQLFDEGPGNLGGMFFKSIDESWNQMSESWARAGLDIAMNPMLMIVLSRANNRSMIEKTVLELRDEFERARSELWGLFADALHADNLQMLERLINRIEREAKSIVPKSMKANDFWFPIRLIWKFNPANAVWGDLIKATKEWIPGKEYGYTMHMVDAARLMTEELRQVEALVPLIAKHFSDGEIETLRISEAVISPRWRDQ